MIGEDIPGIGIVDLDPASRALVWSFRAIACRRVCDARIAMGLSSLVPLKQAALTAAILRRLWEALQTASPRAIQVAAAPDRGLSWDEAALLMLITTDRTQAARIETWWRRLGVDSVGETLRRDLTLVSEIFAEHGAAPVIPGVTVRARPQHEPEAVGSQLSRTSSSPGANPGEHRL
jgi:hypothetical protein